MKPRPLVTLFTDASYCPDQHVAGYAAWFKVDGPAHQHSGPLKGAYQGSYEAETAAMINGLWHVGREVQGAHVIIEADCVDAIHLLTGRRPPRGDWQAAAVQRWEEIQAKAQLTVEVRHAKAHNGTGNPRRWVNDWCDKAAKTHMRAARSFADGNGERKHLDHGVSQR